MTSPPCEYPYSSCSLPGRHEIDGKQYCGRHRNQLMADKGELAQMEAAAEALRARLQRLNIPFFELNSWFTLWPADSSPMNVMCTDKLPFLDGYERGFAAAVERMGSDQNGGIA